MAMGLYPETMKKAQEEIDAVFGSDTLPNFSRMQELRYTMALIKETIRLAFLSLHNITRS
jgi:hypothetical protein